MIDNYVIHTHTHTNTHTHTHIVSCLRGVKEQHLRAEDGMRTRSLASAACLL